MTGGEVGTETIDVLPVGNLSQAIDDESRRRIQNNFRSSIGVELGQGHFSRTRDRITPLR